MKPLISVCIPSFNYGRYIENAVDSVLRQTYPNIEVVITDNGSTDDSIARLTARYGDDERVRVIENGRNIGLVPNFNHALAHARGEFVLWLCADDWLLRDHLTRLAALFDAEPAIDVVYSGVYFADEQQRIYAVKAQSNMFPVDYIDARDELVEMLATYCQLCLPSALFRRALFDEVGAMDPAIPICADWELIIRLAVRGKRFAYLNEPSAVVRVHDGNASGKAFHNSGGYVAELLTILEKFVDDPGFAPALRQPGNALRFVETMITSTIQTIGYDPFDSAIGERLERLRENMDAPHRRAPATVSEARISVIVTATGPPPLTLRAIESVVTQTHSQVEIVVVDQAAISLRHMLRDRWPERIAYLRLPAPGPLGAARNFGLRMARGSAIAFLDDDNTFDPEHLATLAAAMDTAGTPIAVAPARIIIERPDPALTAIEPIAQITGVFRERLDDPADIGLIANGIALNSLLIDRHAIDAAGEFNASVALLEDFDFIVRLGTANAMTFARDISLSLRLRLGLDGHTLYSLAPFYLPTLDALYAARPGPLALESRRQWHRALVAAALADIEVGRSRVEGIAELMGVLSGRRFIELSSVLVPAEIL